MQYRAIITVVIFALLFTGCHTLPFSVITDNNPAAYLLKYTYSGLVTASTYLAETAGDIYYKNVQNNIHLENTSTALNSALTTHAPVAWDTLKNHVATLKANVITLPYYDDVKDQLVSLNALVDRLQKPDEVFPTDETDAQSILADLYNRLRAQEGKNNVQISGAKHSFLEHAKYYFLQTVNFFIHVVIEVTHYILKHVSALTLISFAITATALLLAYTMGLAFVRVFIWIVKLPFRIIRGIYRFIFGKSKELDMDADLTSLREECGKAPEVQEGQEVPVPVKETQKVPLPVKKTQKKNASKARRLVGDDDLSNDNLVGEDDFVLGAEEVDPKKAGPKGHSASSAAVVSITATLVAAVALLL